MNGLWLENGVFTYREDLPMPEAGEHELLVRTLCAGICGTDIELQRGYYDFHGVAGHEFVGEIIGSGRLAGKRIVADINIGCGRCQYCLQGLRNHCSSRKVVGIKNQPGAFAEFLVVPEENVHVVPDALSNQQAVLDEITVPLQTALDLKVGSQILLNATPRSSVTLRCGDSPLFIGSMGRKDGSIAVRVDDKASRALKIKTEE